MRFGRLGSLSALIATLTLCGCSDSTSPKNGNHQSDPVDVQGTWTGAWVSSAHEMDGDFRVDLLQEDAVLSGTIDIPELGMLDAQVSGTVTGSSITFGDIDQRITFAGTVAADTLSATGTYVYPGSSDQGAWEATKGTGGVVNLASFMVVPASFTGDITFAGGRIRLLGASQVIYSIDPAIGVIDSTATPGSYSGGIAFDGQALLVGDGPMGAHRIFKMDPTHPSVLLAPGSGVITGLAFDGANLWCVSDHYAASRIYRINADGSVIDSLTCAGTSPRGLAYDGSHLWYTAMNGGQTTVYRVTQSGVVETSFAAPSFLLAGIAFDGAHLWCAGLFDGTIYQLDTDGNVLTSFAAPGSAPADLAFDGTHLWIADGDISPGADLIYRLDTLGNIVSSINCPGKSPGGLAFDGAHLWNADTQSGRIYRLDVSEDNYWSYPSVEPRYLTHDGTCLWSNDPTAGTVFRFDASGEIVTTFDAPCDEIGGLTWDGTSLWIAARDFLYMDALLRVSPSGQVLAAYQPAGQLPAPYGLAFDGADLWYIGQVPFGMEFKLFRLELE